MPKVIRVELPEGKDSDWWPCFDLSKISNAAFDRAWFEDFQAQWRRALANERWRFYARLEAI